MKISNEKPPNYEIIKLYFPNLELHKPLFCYGDTIYNPFKREVTKDLEIHEEIHSKQQGNEPEVWYFSYCTNLAFRLRQEIEAYGTQWAFIKSLDIPSKIKEWKLEKLSDALASDFYGNMLNYQQAKSKIRNYAKHLAIK